jgi:hypothetical protein
LEGDVGIDPEQVRERFLRQEFEHDHVAAARDQALAVEMQDAGKTKMSAVQRQAEYARDVIHADPRYVAGRREHGLHRLQGGNGKHGQFQRSVISDRYESTLCGH